MGAKILWTVAASALVFLSTSDGWCVSGDLDPSFGNNGIAIATFGGSLSGASALARQSDGMIVAAGGAADKFGVPTTIAVARFDSNGVLDPTFDNDGMTTTKVGAFNDGAAKVLLQSDDKIVVVGRSHLDDSMTTADIVLVRYNTDGSLDAGFGTGGIVSTSLGPDDDYPYSAAIQADDKVIVTGGSVSTMDTSVDMFVARFDTAGALDSGFGTGGIVRLDFGGRGDAGHAVVVQPDGYIVVAGASFNGPLFLDGAVATLTRLDPFGVPDALFGTGGSVVESGPNLTIFNALVLENDGDVIVYGASGPGSIVFRLYKYDASGVLDGTFAGGPSNRFMTAVVPDVLAAGPAGEFVMLGDQYTFARIASDGSLDTDFGIGGYAFLGVGAAANALATLIQPSGDIILAGSTRNFSGPDGYTMTLVRVLGSSPACAVDSDCGGCEHCALSGFCAIGTRSGCTVGTSGGAKLAIRNRASAGKSKVKFKWAGTVPSIDPSVSDDVTLCVFQSGARLLKATTPAAGTCDSAPCWSGNGTSGFVYVDKEKTPNGVKKMKVSSTAISANAAGPQLDLAGQGVPDTASLGSPSPPVLMQIQTGDNACVEATFDTVRKVTGSVFSGHSD